MAITTGQKALAADVNVLAKLTVSETEVYAGESPAAAWADLNLSGTVGAKSTLVILKFNFDTAISMAVRKNGDTDAFHSCNSEIAAGAAYARNATATNGYYVLIATTDTSGIMEWWADTAETGTIDIIAYINATG